MCMCIYVCVCVCVFVCVYGLFNGKSRNNFCDMYMYVVCCDVSVLLL